jgi:hypothetical protein
MATNWLATQRTHANGATATGAAVLLVLVGASGAADACVEPGSLVLLAAGLAGHARGTRRYDVFYAPDVCTPRLLWDS